MLIQMLNQKEKLTDLDLFTSLLRYLPQDEAEDFNILNPNDIILYLSQNDEGLQAQVLAASQTLLEEARRNGRTISGGVLLLYQGIFLMRGTSDELRSQLAIRFWEDCQSLYLSSRYELMHSRSLAAQFVAQHYFHQATKQSVTNEEREQHLFQLMRLKRLSIVWIRSFQPKSYLASYHVQQNEPEEARKVFKEDIAIAFDILSDEDPDNDFYGYRILANVLMHTGDDLNALSAWSLLGSSDLFKPSDAESPSAQDPKKDKLVENGIPSSSRNEIPSSTANEMPLPIANGSALPSEDNTSKDPQRQAPENSVPAREHENGILVKNGTAGDDDNSKSSADREGPLSYSCDGACNHSWSYADDLCVCRYCPDTQFNRVCFNKLEVNKLERYVCDPGHSWLHVPPWSDQEALEVGQGKVRVRGELMEGKRVGGEIVDIEE